MSHSFRHRCAALLAATLAVYVTIFAAQTHTWIDLPTWLDLTEWPATLMFLAAAWCALKERTRLAAILTVGALLAFYLAQSQHLFAVPLGFIFATTIALIILLLMPATTR